VFQENKDCQRIAKIEGIGLITATAIIADIGDAKVFKNCRHLAAFWGWYLDNTLAEIKRGFWE